MEKVASAMTRRGVLGAGLAGLAVAAGAPASLAPPSSER
jgi:hypothetical protein